MTQNAHHTFKIKFHLGMALICKIPIIRAALANSKFKQRDYLVQPDLLTQIQMKERIIGSKVCVLYVL